MKKYVLLFFLSISLCAQSQSSLLSPAVEIFLGTTITSSETFTMEAESTLWYGYATGDYEDLVTWITTNYGSPDPYTAYLESELLSWGGYNFAPSGFDAQG